MDALSRTRTLLAVALSGAISLVSLSASADPPTAPPAAPLPPGPAAPASPVPALPGAPGLAIPGVGAPGGAQADKPSLVKELPIASYVITPLVAGGGAALNVFGQNAENDLKDPSKHTTPDATHSLVVKARAGQVISYVLFPITGITALWGTISTIRAVMKVSKMVKPPPAMVGAAPLPGGMAVAVTGRF